MNNTIVNNTISNSSHVKPNCSRFFFPILFSSLTFEFSGAL